MTQADVTSRRTGGAARASARPVLGGPDEETALAEDDADCDADIVLGHDWLRARGLAFLYDADAARLCSERGCASGRRVRLDLALDVAAASPATRLSPAEARAVPSTVGLGAVPTLGRPALWCPRRAAPHEKQGATSH